MRADVLQKSTITRIAVLQKCTKTAVPSPAFDRHVQREININQKVATSQTSAANKYRAIALALFSHAAVASQTNAAKINAVPLHELSFSYSQQQQARRVLLEVMPASWHELSSYTQPSHTQPVTSQKCLQKKMKADRLKKKNSKIAKQKHTQRTAHTNHVFCRANTYPWNQPHQRNVVRHTSQIKLGKLGVFFFHPARRDSPLGLMKLKKKQMFDTHHQFMLWASTPTNS